MTNQPIGWMTIREAALAMGVSELTIRRRIKLGRLAHRLEAGKYYVNPSDGGPSPAPLGMSGSGAITGHELEDEIANAKPGSRPPDELVSQEFLPRLGRLAEQAGRATALEEQLVRTEAECRELRDGMVALSSRNGWLESKLEEREQSLKLLTDHAQSRGWWRRLFR